MTERTTVTGRAASPFDAWLAERPRGGGALGAEAGRQSTTLQLIASENFTSPAVLAATGSVLTNKYSEGYPGRRYYGGNRVIDEVEDLARDRAKALFGAEHANVQPHAGANANLAVYQALLEPGDTVLAMRLDQGGHLTHGSPASITSKIWRFVAYGVTPASGDPDRPGEVIDFDQVADVAKRERPEADRGRGHRLSPPHRPRAVPGDRRRGRGPAHVRRRPSGRAHRRRGPPESRWAWPTSSRSPPTRPCADPRGGAILCRAELAKAIDSAVFPGLQGGPLEHVIAAKAVAFGEAAQPGVPRLRRRGRGQRPGPGRRPWPTEGFRLVSGGTDNHLMLVDLRPFDAELTGKEAQEILDRAGITLNRNTIPDDPRSPFVTSGLRLGTAAETTAGMGARDGADRRADRPARCGSATTKARWRAVRGEVPSLCGGFPPYPPLVRAGGGAAGRRPEGG